MAYPNESNKEAKREEKIRKYEQLCFELRERREGYTVKVILMDIGCLGGGMKELKVNMKRIFDNDNDNDNDKEIELIVYGMQKTVLWESIRTLEFYSLSHLVLICIKLYDVEVN